MSSLVHDVLLCFRCEVDIDDLFFFVDALKFVNVAIEQVSRFALCELHS